MGGPIAGQGLIHFVKNTVGTKTNWRVEIAIAMAAIFTALNALRPVSEIESKSGAPFTSAVQMFGVYLVLNLIGFWLAGVLLPAAPSSRPRWKIGLTLLIFGALAIRLIQTQVQGVRGEHIEFGSSDVEGFISSAVLVPTVFLAIAAINQMIEVLKELQARSEFLSELISKGADSLATMSENIRVEVNETLAVIRASIGKNKNDEEVDPKRFSSTLQAATKSALSLMSLLEKVERDPVLSPRPRGKKAAPFPRVNARELFSPDSLIILFLLLFFVRWAIYQLNWSLILASATTGLVFIGIALIARNLAGTINVLTLTLIKLVFGVLTVLGGNYFLIANEVFAPLSVSRALLVSSIYVSATSGHLIYKHSARKLERVNQDLAREVSLLERKTWAIKEHYQNSIHGTLKASLFYASLRVSQKSTTKADIAILRATLEKALVSENFEPQQNQGIEQQLDGVLAIWRNVAEIDVKIERDCQQVIDSNFETKGLVREIVREAAANALRHGSATKVKVDITSIDRNLEIICINDGNAAPRSLVGGSGSKLFDALCLDWRLSSVGSSRSSQTTLLARIAAPESEDRADSHPKA